MNRKHPAILRVAALAALALSAARPATPARADESLAGIACRSVHLSLNGPPGDAFYHEAVVERSADGTYFCAAGFNVGYFGVQELANGRKLVLFSVWDPASGDDPNAVPEEIRVKVLEPHPGTRVRRFGNEGTGGQCFHDYDWKVGQTLRFLVTVRPDPEDPARARFTGWFHHPEQQAWIPLVTFAAIVKRPAVSGHYAFVEDFRRNRVSTTKARVARFGNGWVRALDGTWTPLARARFTADANPALNIDAETVGRGFRLATGGDTENKNVRLRDFLEWNPPADADPPAAPPDDVRRIVESAP